MANTKFRELYNARSAKAKARVEARVRKALGEMPVQEFQQARQLSLAQLANILEVKPATISKLERRTDMYIHTLRGYIETMGGNLDIVARFPEGEVKIQQFSNST